VWDHDRVRDDPAPVLSGAAADVASRLGVEPVVVRLALIVLAAAGGAGVLVYALLWLRLVRTSGGARAGRPGRVVDPPRPVDAAGQVGLALALLGALLLLRTVGLWFGDAVVIPVALGSAGSLLVWTRGDPAGRDAWSPPPAWPALRRLAAAGARVAGGPSASPARLLGGIALVALAMLTFLVANDAMVAVRELAAALLAATAGLALLFGPWALRLLEVVGAERRARIREEERGEIAAHLHDSVLQTLALIQRASDEPSRMVALARRQERELRRWLAQGITTTDATTLSGALDEVVTAVEAAHPVTVEVVRVGDAAMSGGLTALVAAVREAVLNAARHAGVPTVSVFVEVGPDEVVAFVRDRGHGFSPDRVPDDRGGIRHAIRGRLAWRGGRAVLTASPGEGCEWELAVPVAAEEGADVD